MLPLTGLRAFSLSVGRDSRGISCDERGVFVGDIPLLAQRRGGTAKGIWTARPVAELNDELTARYGLPIDVAAKTGALALIANALSRGDLVMAAIATVQMQFPDPPPLAKAAESDDEIIHRAAELCRSGLLKAALQGPKTLEELQQAPAENGLGYEQHHIVNQNPDNLQKGTVAKFGSELINDPSNIVWVPRLQHECVNSEYSSNSTGPGTPLVRELINKMDFQQQREEGLKILRKCGVLK